MTTKLFAWDTSMTTLDVIVAMERAGYTPATGRQLHAFRRSGWGGEGYVVALGSHRLWFLDFEGGEVSVYPERWQWRGHLFGRGPASTYHQWRPYTEFLAIKKP